MVLVDRRCQQQKGCVPAAWCTAAAAAAAAAAASTTCALPFLLLQPSCSTHTLHYTNRPTHLARPCSPPSREGASLRAEAEAPFRSLRLFLFGAGVAGAGLATLFSLPGLIGSLAGAPNATKSAAEALQDLAINIGSLAVCGYFVWSDLQVGMGLRGWGCRGWEAGCTASSSALLGSLACLALPA